MFVTLLCTGLSLLACSAAAIMAFLARQSADRAAHSEHRLAIMRGQVAGLEAAMMGLDAKHQKLAGRVYADEYWRGKTDRQPELQPINADDMCPNWATAQREGPGSAASMCECVYCATRREARRAARANLRAGVKS